MTELSVAAEQSALRTIRKDRKNPDIDLFMESFQPTVVTIGAAALAREGARVWSAYRLDEALSPLSIELARNSSKRNAFIRRTAGAFPAFSKDEQNDLAVGLAGLIPKPKKRGAISKTESLFERFSGYLDNSAKSLVILSEAVEPKTQQISARLITGAIKDEIVEYFVAQDETRKNRHSKSGTTSYGASRRYWEYCLDAADDRAKVDAWTKVKAGLQAKARFLRIEIQKAEATRTVRLARASGVIIQGIRPRLVPNKDLADKVVNRVPIEHSHQAPPSAQKHIANATSGHNIFRENTYEHQYGGGLAAKLNTRGVRGTFGSLPGEKPAPKTEKGRRPKRWEQPVRHYLSPRDAGPHDEEAKRIREDLGLE